MINILFAADFPISKTGIESTAFSILETGVLDSISLYSIGPLKHSNFIVEPFENISSQPVHLVFTHIEYSGLPNLQSRYPHAIFHVGDWPLHYWNSVQRFNFLKGTLAKIRCKFRLNKIDKKTNLAFVTKGDLKGAKSYGFNRSLHFPIGVKIPLDSLSSEIDMQTICFSGNFRYTPNRNAADKLINIIRDKMPEMRILLIGYYAGDFYEKIRDIDEICADVNSVVDFLAARRPIYVSLIQTGAGAKNKILEALAAGCPIICTPESLDSSTSECTTVKCISHSADVVKEICLLKNSNMQAINLACIQIAEQTRRLRSWDSVAKKILSTILKQPIIIQ